MPRPIPTSVCHFTHIDHLAAIVEHGLLCDSRARAAGHLTTEAGEPRIKAQRAKRTVKAGSGGVVADYVPFYFHSRSPMLYSIRHGGVPTFTGDAHDLVYLRSSVETLIDFGLPLVFTDRNATLEICRHTDQLGELDGLVDWQVMRAKMWNNTGQYPDRVERRMAECLVHDRVPWEAFTEISVYDAAREQRVLAVLDRVGGHRPPVSVVPKAYF